MCWMPTKWAREGDRTIKGAMADQASTSEPLAFGAADKDAGIMRKSLAHYRF